MKQECACFQLAQIDGPKLEARAAFPPRPRSQVDTSLVPKLHLGTQLSRQFHCLSAAFAKRQTSRSQAAKIRAFPSATLERGDSAFFHS